eukprot:jgi/Picre1/34164/NNA_001638.t1
MAPALYKLIPWTKIIISLREPISRAASMLIHMKDVYNEGCLAEKDLGYCLHARSQIRGLHDGTNTYYDALSEWFKHWPAEQIHIVQYEELTNPDTEDSTIWGVKEFIGLDPNLPKAGLTVINDRRFRIQPDGWPMAKKQYEKVINLVKPDVEATLDLMERHGKVKDRKKWMERWESVGPKIWRRVIQMTSVPSIFHRLDRWFKMAGFAGAVCVALVFVFSNVGEYSDQEAAGYPGIAMRTIKGLSDVLTSFTRPESSLRSASDVAKPEDSFSLKNQESIITDAQKRVRSAANSDKTIETISRAADEESEEREAALAAMMGINHGSEDTSAAPIDKTAVRARRSLDRVEALKDYIQRILRVNRYAAYDGQLANYEASTHYSRAGHRLAPMMAREMPWLKVILLLREPISRAASMLVHILDKNMMIKNLGPGRCLKHRNMDLGECLLRTSQISGQRSFPTNYSTPLEAWLTAFPKGQVYVGQYEALIDDKTQKEELRKIKKFIGIDPNLPTGGDAEFMSRNSRKGSINPDGWPMKRDVYQHAIDIVLEDSKKVARLVDKYGFADAKTWLSRWEDVWQANMDSCDAQGNCKIQLS